MDPSEWDAIWWYRDMRYLGIQCDTLIFGGSVDNPSTRRISVLGRLAPSLGTEPVPTTHEH